MTFPWLEEMQPGSFAGIDVRFPAMRVERGRHVVLTEVPGGDRGHFRDLGLRVRQWELEFYVIGDNFHIRTQELEDKIDNTRGPWPLVDPWRGESQVEIIGPVSVSHSTDAGGMATFRFRCALADPLEFPALASPVAAVETAIPVSTSAIRQDFESKFTIGKLQSIVRAALGVVTTAMRKVNGQIANALASFDDIGSQIDQWENFVNNTNSTPAQLFGSLVAVWDGAKNLLLELLRGPDIDLRLNDGAGRDSGYTEPTALIGEILDAIASTDLGAADIVPDVAASVDGIAAVQAITVAEFAYKSVATNAVLAALVTMEIPSEEQAAAMQEQIVTYFADLLAYDVDGAVLESIADTQAAVLDWVVSEATRAPSTVDVYVGAPIPATVLAKRLHGDSRRHVEILRRNSVHVPARVEGTIKVSRDG